MVDALADRHSHEFVRSEVICPILEKNIHYLCFGVEDKIRAPFMPYCLGGPGISILRTG